MNVFFVRGVWRDVHGDGKASVIGQFWMTSMLSSEEPPKNKVKPNKKRVKLPIHTMDFDHMPTPEEIVNKLKAELDEKKRKQAGAVEPARR